MVQILEANPNVGWGSIGAAFGSGLGQGLQEARQMTMADKMQVLKQQRELQAQEQRLSMIDKQFPGMGNAVRAVGPQGAAMIIKEYGPEGISRIFGPQDQFQAPRTTALSGLQQEIPYEDREAIEEAQEFPSAQRLEGYPGEMAVKKRPLPEREITSLDEYRRKIAPNYDQLGKTAEESVDRRAEREFNAAMNIRKQEFKEQEPIREFEKTAADKLSGWHKQKTSLKFIADHADEMGKHAGIKKKIADKLGIPVGELLNPTEQVMEKITTQLAQNISSVFPGRILVSELETYMRSNPTLANDPKAMKEIAQIMLETGDMAEKEYKAVRSLKKEYPDIGDLREKLEEKLAPEYDAINGRINKIIGSEGGKEESNTITMVSPSGKIGQVPRNKIDEAKKAGYKLK